MTFETNLADLPNKKLTSGQLVGFSNLTDEEVARLEPVWEETPMERRLALVTALSVLVEDNIELNFDALFKFALADQNPDVREAALQGLYEYEESDLIERLADLLLGDPDSGVRAEAAIALGRYALMAEFERLFDSDRETVRRALTEAIEDDDEEDIVRAKALEALGVLSDDETHDLIERLYGAESLWLRIGAVDAMGRNSDEDWLPIVVEEMENRAPEMRQAAAFAAGEIGSEDAIEALAGLAVHDPDRPVQLAAIHALGEIGGGTAKVALQAALYEGDDELREAVEEAMAEVAFKDDPLRPLGL
jgi:HEAT repeat protein